jgi:hypothetical protein
MEIGINTFMLDQDPDTSTRSDIMKKIQEYSSTKPVVWCILCDKIIQPQSMLQHGRLHRQRPRWKTRKRK